MRRIISSSLVILMLASILSLSLTLDEVEATGNETISITINGGQHFDDGETITFTINVGNLDSAYSYQLEWRLCEYQGDNDGNWIDGSCYVMSPYIMYDDMMNGIWYSSADGLEIGGEVNVPNSGQTYTWQESITQIQDFVDPNGNTIQLSNGQNVPALYLQNGLQYQIGAILSISGVYVTDSVSDGFAYGHAGYPDIDLERAGNILENMDYEFQHHLDYEFSSDIVPSTLEWEITDVATSTVVDSGSGSAGSGTTTIAGGTLPIGDYQLKAWSSVDGNPLPTQYMSGVTVDDGNDVYYLDFSLNTYNQYYTHDFSVVQGTTTGLEEITLSNILDHYSDGDLVSSDVAINNLDSNTAYDLSWRLCEYQGDNDGNWIDGSCYVMSPYIMYDDMMNGIWYSSADGLEIGGEFNDVNSGATSANNIVQIEQIQDFVDPNGNTIQLSNGQNVPALYLQNGLQYQIGAILSISGVYVTDSVSDGFAYGHAGYPDIDLERAGNILENMDYEFQHHLDYEFSSDIVPSTLEWEITDVATSTVVDSGSGSAGSGTTTIAGGTLPIGDYQLKAWSSVDGNPLPTQYMSGVTVDDGNDVYYLDFSLNTYNQYYTHDFSVVQGTTTGLEEITLSNILDHYSDGDLVSSDVAINNLDSNTAYDLSWRLCEYQGDNDGNWIDGSCYVMSPYIMYDDMMNGIWYSSADGLEIGGEFNDVNSGATSANNIVQIEQIQDFVDPNGNTIQLSNGQNVPALYLQNGLQYQIGAILSISGVYVTDSVSDGFAYGHAGYPDIDLERAGNILENMDYEFQHHLDYEFSSDIVPSTLEWEITDVATSTVVDSGSGSAGSGTTTIAGGTLPIGDYQLKAWSSVDGNPLPTQYMSGVTVDDGNDVYYLDFSLNTYNQYYTHEFSVIDPSFGTLASFTPALPTISMQGNEWASITSTVDQLNSGDLHKIVWRIYEQSTPNVDIINGEEQWVAPPLTYTVETNTNLLTETGDLCYEAELYVGANGPFDSQTACWTQSTISSTSDADSDGVMDNLDHCPFEAANNDIDGDGCEDPQDSDQDGLPDLWEVGFGLNPADPSDATADGDNDGLNNLQEFATMTSPISADTDMDMVNDGSDACPLTPGTGVDGCPTGSVNLPPTCDIFFSIEADGLVAQGDAALPGILPGQLGLTIELPEGNYYIIAVCSDPEGDSVTVTLNNDVVTTGVASATAGILISISEGTNAQQTLTIDWSDGVNSLQTTLDVVLEEDDSGAISIPGFTFIVGILAIISALIVRKQN